MMYYYYGNGMGWWEYGLAGIFFNLVWFALIIWLVLMILRSIRRSGRWPLEPKSALDILKERYAKGEINKEEYEERKKTLEG